MSGQPRPVLRCASSRGMLVPGGGFVGRIELVTSRAVVCRSDRHWSDPQHGSAVSRFVVLDASDPPPPRSPIAVLVPDLRCPEFAVGSRVRITDGAIWFGVARQIGVDLASARRWCPPALPTLSSAALDRLDSFLRVSRGAVLGAAQVRLDGRLDAVAAALMQVDTAALDRSVDRTIGFGPGLTPSGDDGLIGLLGLLGVLGQVDRAVGLCDRLARSILARLGATTGLSGCLLRLAAEGLPDEAVADVLGCADTGGPALVAAVDRLRSAGATSGADTLLGIMVGATIASVHLGRSAA